MGNVYIEGGKSPPIHVPLAHTLQSHPFRANTNPPKHGTKYTSKLSQNFDYNTFLQNELKALAIYTLIINMTTFTYS